MDDRDEPPAQRRPRTPETRAARPQSPRTDLRMLFPLYQPAQEIGDRWLTRAYAGPSPQEGRDALAHHFLKQTHELEPDPGRKRDFADAANLLDWERHDELLVLGHRYRVVRIERYVRFTKDEPDRPRPTDPAPAPSSPAPGESERSARQHDIDLTSDAETDADSTALKAELRELVPAGGPIPREVTEDALVRHMAYPDVVVLPPGFQLLMRLGGERAWRPFGSDCTTPDEAREDLRQHLAHRSRSDGEWNADTTTDERTAYGEALAEVEAKGLVDAVSVRNRHYRVARVIRIARVGFDGPETPRESDHDPYPPPAAQHLEAHEQGLLDEDDEGPPDPPGEEAKKFLLGPG
ncbi:DUF5954 family protein [Nocardiopsis sediminis]|uniref:DUF5954 family protein n=1 Tax=Nocardiopsis sediminis TaxID=1778267 RepID=A0ABV8FQD9_9ACTN